MTLGSLPNKTPGKYSIPRWKTGFNARAIDRNIVKEAFGNMEYRSKDGVSKYPLRDNNSKTTPFRTTMNAGDAVNGTVNKDVDVNALPRPSNQVNVRNLSGLKLFAGSVQTQANGSYYSGNPSYVYDGSDYARYKRLKAINNNFNDPTFGGDRHNAAQSAIRRVRI